LGGGSGLGPPNDNFRRRIELDDGHLSAIQRRIDGRIREQVSISAALQRELAIVDRVRAVDHQHQPIDRASRRRPEHLREQQRGGERVGMSAQPHGSVPPNSHSACSGV
jgi:hypothetical protein